MSLMPEPPASTPRPANDAPARPHAIAGVRHVLAVSSGKGGVGKSTTAMNLTLALADEGWRVGLLDADIHGPSVPMMMGATGRRATVEDEGRTLRPVIAHGVPLMSVGLLMSDDAPLIWRGAAASQMLEQMLRQTVWGALDCLVIDMPPGTGDVPLSLCQRAPLSGAVIVTTPQDVALLDVAKGARMFEKARVPMLGIVENMAVHVCKGCGHEAHLFGRGGAGRLHDEWGVPVLASLPLDRRVCLQADGGTPIVRAEPDGGFAARYRAMARELMTRLVEQTPPEVEAAASALRIEVSPDT